MTAIPRFLILILVPALMTAAAPAIADQSNLALVHDTHPHPDIIETTLVARPATLDLGGGLTADVYTFNGRIPGPKFQVKVGDTVIVHFRNELPENSSIHWHGIEVNNASDGTPVTQNEVAPGESYTYRFRVLRPGVFWYHPHFRPGNQVFKGLSGPFIVTDANERRLQNLRVLPNAGHTKTLVLGDITICKEPGENDSSTFPDNPDQPWAANTGGGFPGHPFGPSPRTLCESPQDHMGLPMNTGPLPAGAVPNVMPAHDCPGSSGQCRTNEGQVVLANGRTVAPRSGSPSDPGDLPRGVRMLNGQAGQGLRLQIISTAVARYFRLKMTDANGQDVPLVRVGGEGGLLDRARIEGGVQQSLDTKYDPGEIVLGPGDRADVVITLPEGEPGDVLTIWTRDYPRAGSRSGAFAFIPTVPVLHVRLTGSNGRHRYHIDEFTELLADPRIEAPIENIKSFPIDELVDEADMPIPFFGSDNEAIRLTNRQLNGLPSPSIDGLAGRFNTFVDNYTDIPALPNSRYARVGNVIEFEVTNATGAHHTFHQHGFSFQPLELRGPGSLFVYDYNEFVDNVDIPAGHTLVYRIRLIDRPMMDGTPGGAVGRWIYHCHIFHHAEQGMISELVVLPAP